MYELERGGGGEADNERVESVQLLKIYEIRNISTG